MPCLKVGFLIKREWMNGWVIIINSNYNNDNDNVSHVV